MTTRRGTAFFHDERSLQDGDEAGVRRRLLALMAQSGLMQQLALRGAAPASEVDLRRVHDGDYLASFKALSDHGGGELGDCAPFGPGGYELARLSAGLALQAVDEVLSGRSRNAYALTRPGHHCLPELAMGGCLLANIPIAIEAVLAKHGPRRVAVVDWDAHHGNGTQAVYYRRSDVLTISLHQDRGFPAGYGGLRDRGEGAGRGFNLNIPMPPGSGHEAYLHAMERIVAPAVERFEPALIVVAAGYGANAVEPLARMLLHADSFRAMTARLVALAERHCDGALVMVHEGGAAESCVPQCAHAAIEALSGAMLAAAIDDPLLALIDAQQPGARLVEFQKSCIEAMREET
ncbi:class II histone deacetylase [Paucibacter sp. R3-3]|uniref:Class II histone deacetylase n=1 Tax=Roseateles agri TaxID=3098619 RepID=A0ABU5DJ19_9BURK|nr:class II histone deacetylase [Paucibacter sp. R3-3]MDY0745229.1 class II histone deacetylase [Paucibacter sp. R3-3]